MKRPLGIGTSSSSVLAITQRTGVNLGEAWLAKCINLTHLHNSTVGTMEPPNGDELAGRGAAGVLGLHLYWIVVLCTTNPSTAFCTLHLKGNQAHKGGLISTRFSSSGRSPLHHGEAVRPRKSPRAVGLHSSDHGEGP